MIQRKRPRSSINVGHDAFLDIVANLVGILIILVVVLGSQSTEVLEEIESSESQIAEATPDQFEAIELASHRADAAVEDSRRIEASLKRHDVKLANFRQTRDQLLDLVSIARETLDEHRNGLSERHAEELQFANAVEQAQSHLASLQSTRQSIESQKAPIVSVEHLPTPMAKTVYHDEVHLRIKDNRISVVPIEALLEEVETSAKLSLRGSGDGQQRETVGPIRGWIAKHVLDRQTGGSMGRRIRSVQMLGIVFEPLNPNVGQTIDMITSGRSAVDVELAGRDPAKTTVTTWVYPNSFATHRQLQRYLYAKGFTTAARPMNHRDPIGASPNGSRSKAQ